jgi:colicin import membrane protein
MAERASDRWISIVLSVLLHGALLAAVGYGWWTYKKERPLPTLAIEATVVDARSIAGVGKQPPQPQPPPPAPVTPPEPPPPVEEPTGPPQPTPEELAKREQAQKEQAEREAQEKRQAEDQQRKAQEKQQEAALAVEKRAEDKRAEDKRAEEKRQADEQRKAQEKAEADRKAREAAEAKKRADEKRLEDQKRQADEQAKADREAELKRSLDQEMRADAARSSGALASWVSQITARIQRAWLKPPSAKTGIECVLYVTQVPGGEVTNVRIGACNGDQAVRESIEAAVYRASPLPPPSDPTLFERDLVITFRPN